MYTFCDKKRESKAMEMAVRIFGDPADYTRDMFLRGGTENLFLEVDGEDVAAMAFMLPFTLGNKKGHYIYGACTSENRRGQGRMTSLLNETDVRGKARGDEFSFLVPASVSLFEFYRQRGYNKPFYCASEKMSVCGNELAELTELSEREFISKRTELLCRENAMCHGLNAIKMAYYDVMSSSGRVLSDGRNMAVCYPENSGLFIKELIAVDNEKEAIINSILKMYGVDFCTVYGPGGKNQKVKGLIKCYSDIPDTEIYGNLLLD